MTEFKFIDLFSGIGGFRLAAEKHGGVSVGFSEIDKDAILYYCENFNDTPENNFGDITKIVSLPEHDLMMAGVPCQSWSIAGKQLGFDDDRGKLWNDTLYLLNKSRPKVFIFENVKGLSDPRNNEAFSYILDKIRQSGYHCNHFLINSNDYGVPQNRVRVYIIGFKDKTYLDRLSIPEPIGIKPLLGEVMDDIIDKDSIKTDINWFEGYFQFNDLRNGDTTIHSWDIHPTTEKEKEICNLLLTNRRKKKYGLCDGNPLSATDFIELDPTITITQLDGLVDKGILKRVPYQYEICGHTDNTTENEKYMLSTITGNMMTVDRNIISVEDLKKDKSLKIKKIDILKTLHDLESKGIIRCIDTRYDFRNTKISTGIDGVNRIYTPSASAFSTLVASDSNDFVMTEEIHTHNLAELKRKVIDEIFIPKRYRKITKEEACRIQGFTDDFVLPDSRSRWMHLIGNSVSVKVVDMLVGCIVSTGVFD